MYAKSRWREERGVFPNGNAREMQLSGGANKGENMIVMESPWTLGFVAFFFSCFGLLAGIAL